MLVSINQLGKSEMMPQSAPRVLFTKQTTLLQIRNDMVDKIVE